MRVGVVAIDHINRIFHRPGLRDVALALGLKVGGSALAFAMLTLAARAMGLHEFGVFAYWFSILSFASAAVLLGQEAVIMVEWQRALSADGVRAARAVLRRSTKTILLAGIFGGAATTFIAHLTGAAWTFCMLAGLFAALLPLLVYGTHVARVVAGILQGDGHFEVTWRLFPMAGAAFAMLAGLSFHAETFFAYACFGLTIALAVQVISIVRAVRGMPTSILDGTGEAYEGDTRDWAARSTRLWLGGVLDAANQYVEICVIGLLLSPIEAGLYYAAARIAALFSIIAAGLHVYASREIAQHAARPRGSEMRVALRLVAGVTALTVSGGILLVGGGGRTLLTLFGPTFEAAYLPLVTLTVGVAAIAVAGPVPALLRLTGHEGVHARIAGACALLRCVSVAIGAMAYGLEAATIASAVCSVVCAIILRRACRRHVGIDPSVFILISGQGRTP